tara:strand:+ start:9733 stop:10149 length:417 start_codon:yes stop_codon:yes gene_type:complete
MAKLTYNGNDKSRALIKRKTIASGESIDFNPIHALSYLGDEDFTISFEASDKEVLKNCSKGQLKKLEAEFGGAGLEQVLDNMYPKSKKIISKASIPKSATKPIKKEEKKIEVETPTIKKKIVVKPTKKIKLESKISES